MSKQTKKKVIAAFEDLAGRYGYDQISVQMIIAKAGIGKTTFYRHFKDKADVMEARFSMMYDEAILASGCKSVEDLCRTILLNAREHPEQKVFFESSGYHSYSEFIYRYTYEIGKKIIERSWGRELTEIEEMGVAFFCAGNSKLFEEFCNGKRFNNITPDEAANKIISMMSQNYRIVFPEKDDTFLKENLINGTD